MAWRIEIDRAAARDLDYGSQQLAFSTRATCGGRNPHCRDHGTVMERLNRAMLGCLPYFRLGRVSLACEVVNLHPTERPTWKTHLRV